MAITAIMLQIIVNALQLSLFKEVQRHVSKVYKVTNESVTKLGAALNLQLLHLKPLHAFPNPKRENRENHLFSKNFGRTLTRINTNQKIHLGPKKQATFAYHYLFPCSQSHTVQHKETTDFGYINPW